VTKTTPKNSGQPKNDICQKQRHLKQFEKQKTFSSSFFEIFLRNIRILT